MPPRRNQQTYTTRHQESRGRGRGRGRRPRGNRGRPSTRRSDSEDYQRRDQHDRGYVRSEKAYKTSGNIPPHHRSIGDNETDPLARIRVKPLKEARAELSIRRKPPSNEEDSSAHTHEADISLETCDPSFPSSKRARLEKTDTSHSEHHQHLQDDLGHLMETHDDFTVQDGDDSDLYIEQTQELPIGVEFVEQNNGQSAGKHSEDSIPTTNYTKSEEYHSENLGSFDKGRQALHSSSRHDTHEVTDVALSEMQRTRTMDEYYFQENRHHQLSSESDMQLQRHVDRGHRDVREVSRHDAPYADPPAHHRSFESTDDLRQSILSQQSRGIRSRQPPLPPPTSYQTDKQWQHRPPRDQPSRAHVQDNFKQTVNRFLDRFNKDVKHNQAPDPGMVQEALGIIIEHKDTIGFRRLLKIAQLGKLNMDAQLLKTALTTEFPSTEKADKTNPPWECQWDAMELLHAQNALDDADKDAFLDQLLKRLVPSSIPTILTRVSAKRLFRDGYVSDAFFGKLLGHALNNINHIKPEDLIRAAVCQPDAVSTEQYESILNHLLQFPNTQSRSLPKFFSELIARGINLWTDAFIAYLEANTPVLSLEVLERVHHDSSVLDKLNEATLTHLLRALKDLKSMSPFVEALVQRGLSFNPPLVSSAALNAFVCSIGSGDFVTHRPLKQLYAMVSQQHEITLDSRSWLLIFKEAVSAADTLFANELYPHVRNEAGKATCSVDDAVMFEEIELQYFELLSRDGWEDTGRPLFEHKLHNTSTLKTTFLGDITFSVARNCPHNLESVLSAVADLNIPLPPKAIQRLVHETDVFMRDEFLDRLLSRQLPAIQVTFKDLLKLLSRLLSNEAGFDGMWKCYKYIHENMGPALEQECQSAVKDFVEHRSRRHEKAITDLNKMKYMELWQYMFKVAFDRSAYERICTLFVDSASIGFPQPESHIVQVLEAMESSGSFDLKCRFLDALASLKEFQLWRSKSRHKTLGVGKTLQLAGELLAQQQEDIAEKLLTLYMDAQDRELENTFKYHQTELLSFCIRREKLRNLGRMLLGKKISAEAAKTALDVSLEVGAMRLARASYHVCKDLDIIFDKATVERIISSAILDPAEQSLAKEVFEKERSTHVISPELTRDLLIACYTNGQDSLREFSLEMFKESLDAGHFGEVLSSDKPDVFHAAHFRSAELDLLASHVANKLLLRFTPQSTDIVVYLPPAPSEPLPAEEEENDEQSRHGEYHAGRPRQVDNKDPTEQFCAKLREFCKGVQIDTLGDGTGIIIRRDSVSQLSILEETNRLPRSRDSPSSRVRERSSPRNVPQNPARSRGGKQHPRRQQYRKREFANPSRRDHRQGRISGDRGSRRRSPSFYDDHRTPPPPVDIAPARYLPSERPVDNRRGGSHHLHRTDRYYGREPEPHHPIEQTVERTRGHRVAPDIRHESSRVQSYDAARGAVRQRHRSPAQRRQYGDYTSRHQTHQSYGESSNHGNFRSHPRMSERNEPYSVPANPPHGNRQEPFVDFPISSWHTGAESSNTRGSYSNSQRNFSGQDRAHRR